MTKPLDTDTALAFAAARMLAVEEAPYLATALFSVVPVAAPGLGTFAVDRQWRLYMDPACFATWTPSQTGAVLQHEVGHLLRDHAGRADSLGVATADHGRWNYAADAEINDDLLEAGTDLPPGCVTPESLGCEAGDFAETYFAAIPPPPAPPPSVGGGGGGGSDGAGQDGQGEGGDGTCGSGAGGPRRAWELGGDSDDGATAGLDPAEADLVRRQVAVEVASHAAKSRGSVPGGWQRWADTELAGPTVAWRQVLGGAIRRAVAFKRGMVDFSYDRPGRRRVRGVLTPAMRRPVPTVAVVVDTSGSMGQDDLDAALAEVKGIARGVGVRGQQLRVLAVDAAVQAVTPLRDASRVVLKGGGGTDMRVGITAAEALRPIPDAVVVLTDGYTPWPAARGRCRLVCAVIAADAPTGTPEWATTVHIPTGA